MKKALSTILIAMAVLFTIASCQKNDEMFANDNGTESISLQKPTKPTVRGDEDPTYDPVIMAYIDSIYGSYYNVSTSYVKSATFSFYGGSTLNIWVFPLKIRCQQLLVNSNHFEFTNHRVV